MTADEKSWMIPWIRTPTPLGELVDAGLLRNSRGTGLATFRRHPSYAIVLSLRGSARYRDANGIDTTVEPGDCIWVAPGLAHQYAPERGCRWDEIFLNFQGAPFSAWLGDRSGLRHPIQHLNDVDRWCPRWLAIARTQPRNFHEAVAVLVQIHLLLNDLIDRDTATRSLDERLDASRLRLESWPASETPKWRELASECGCGYDTWRKAFRQKFGVSPGRHRQDILMQAAARLMARSHLTNDQLADHFGCCDSFHFSKLFKKYHGASPREFRAKHP